MTLTDIEVGDLITRVYDDNSIVRRVERIEDLIVWARLVPEESTLAGLNPMELVVDSASFYRKYSQYPRYNQVEVSSLDYMTNEELDDDDKKIIHSAIQGRISERESTGSSVGLQANQVRGESVQTTRRGSDRELGIITARILPPSPRDEWALRSQRLREQALNTARAAAVERAMSQLHDLQGGGRAANPEWQDGGSTHNFEWTQWAGHSNR